MGPVGPGPLIQIHKGDGRDVQVRPGLAAGELFEKGRALFRGPPARGGVPQVRDLALHRLGEFLIERQRPEPLAGLLARLAQRVHEALVGPHDRCRVGAQGDARTAGERGDVDDLVDALPGRVGEGVGQHQPPFGVRVGNLDGLAVHRLDDVAGLHRRRPGHVLHRGRDPQHAHVLHRLRHRRHHAQHRGRAGHVLLHRDHVLGLLQIQPAAVKGQPLPDDGHGAAGVGRRIVHHDQPRLFGAPFGHRQQRIHPQAGEAAGPQRGHA